MNPSEPSPVPGDDELWPCEKPFTAFGQFGPDMMDTRVFAQGIWWVDRLGHPRCLADMDRAYLTAVIVMLDGDPAFYCAAYLRAATITLVTDLAVGHLSREAVACELGAPRLTDMEPRTWLEGTPLMRALRCALQNR